MPKAVFLDLDGTVYHGTEAIEGAAEFIRALAIPYLFVTNRGNRTPETVAQQLNGMGIDCTAENVLTSAQATAGYLSRGKRAFCIGEDGLKIALQDAGVIVVEDETAVDAVVVSFDRSFDYRKLTLALNHISSGAVFLATNDDHVITVQNGIVPEAGPLVAAVSAATGLRPKLFGKPHAPIMEMALQRLGVNATETVVIGDNLSTDILAGARMGMKSALILTGVSSRADAENSDIKPTWIVEDYGDLVRQVFD
jgi:4-nitrophenyl phosphatase